MTGRPDRRLTRPAWWFVAGYGVSAIGTGLCYPFLAIYLHQVRGLPAGETAVLLLVLAGAAVPMSVYGGALADRHSPRVVAAGALVVQTAGWLVLAAGRGYAAELAALLVIGVGTGLFLPAVIPVIARLSRNDEVKVRTMSLRYLLLNVGLGVGGGLGGLVLGAATDSTYRWLFAADAVSCALYAAVIAALVPLPAGDAAPGRRRAARVPFRPGLSYALLLVAQLLLVTFGMAQQDSGVPLAVRTDFAGSTALVGGLYAVATFVVLAGQLLVSRWVERVHKTRALITMSMTWAGAWLLGHAAGTVAGDAQVALLVAMMVTFALGECAYSPAFYTLVEQLAPPGTLGRSTGAAWATFQVGNTTGPPVAVYLLSTSVPFWLVLAAAAVLAAGLVLVIDRRMHATPPPVPAPAMSGAPS
ncbi:MFS transporter [Dactylosporangium sp. NPDC049525]|uniref:MFS transporter n=1 Tax=Dactylosporangium sp. NPDC049525 TaxID=3154730 RepID=UPI0034362C85